MRGRFSALPGSHYDSNIVRQLNQSAAFRRLFRPVFRPDDGPGAAGSLGGVSAHGAFTPVAARMLQLEQSLVMPTASPQEHQKRFRALVEKQADPVMKEMLKSAHVLGNEMDDIQGHLAVYLYLAQPGGSAEAFLFNNEGLLPALPTGTKYPWISFWENLTWTKSSPSPAR